MTSDLIAILVLEVFGIIGASSIAHRVADFISPARRRFARRKRYAVYCGHQRVLEGFEGFSLWTLTDARLGQKWTTIDEAELDRRIDAFEAHG